MAVPSKPTYSVQPPSVVATDQTVQLAVFCNGATQLDVYVVRAEYVEDLMWSGTFSPISSTAGLFSCPVPLASASLESETQYVFYVQGRNSDGTGQAATAYFTAYDKPIVTITAPTDGATVTALPLIISWDVTDETGVSAQAVIVYHGGDIVYSRYGVETYLRSLEIHASDVGQQFVDGDAYKVNVYVRNGAGLEVNVQNDFSISWAAPVTPTATVTTDPDTLAASVTVTAGSLVNLGEYFAHSLTDTDYWFSTEFSAYVTQGSDGWAHFSYTNSGSSWSYINVSLLSSAVSLEPSTDYTYVIEVANVTNKVRVRAPAVSGSSSVWTDTVNTDFETDGTAYVAASTLANFASATTVRTYLGVPASTTAACDVRISLYEGTIDGPLPATDTLMVVRVNPDGTRHVLADDLESGDSVTDPLPPLGVEYTYEVTGVAESGVPSTVAIVPVTIKTGAWALNFGNNAEECVLFRYNPSASYDIEHGGELYHFADGGANGGLPQWYGTTDRDESGSISWQTADRALAMKLHDLSLAHPVGWIRDPYGRSWYARIAPSMSHERTRVLKVSINWNKVVWKEP